MIPQSDPVVIRVAGVPEHFNLPWMLALERRAFVRAGIEVKWRTVPEGTGAMCKMLRAGEADVAMLVTEGAVRDIVNGNPSRILSSYVDSPLTWGVHVGAHTAINQPAQLKDMPFAISRLNSGSHLAAMAYAQAHGWTPQESDLVVVNDLDGAVERLKQPEPIAFLWEKYTTKHLVDSGAFRCVDEYRSPWPSFVLVASEAILESNSRDVARLLRVIRDQAKGVMEKKTAPEMIAQRYRMSEADAQAWFAGVRWNVDGKLEEGVLERVAVTLREAGMLPQVEGGALRERLWAEL